MVKIFCPSRITGIGGEGGVSVAEPEFVEPEEQLSSQPASASITADAPFAAAFTDIQVVAGAADGADVVKCAQ